MDIEMKNKLIYLSSVIMVCLLPATLQSQHRSEKRHYTFEKIELKNPWLKTGNGAGLVFNKADNYANVGGYFTTESGDYRNFDDPSKYSVVGIETKSYTKMGKVYFYGSFNYDYGVNQDLAWRGTIYPRANLNPITDSIPGKVLRESYIMTGKVGYKLNDRVSIGAEFDYNTSTAAKRVDGRNLNTLSMMNVSPGITYKGGILNLGFNLNYKRDVEEVEYDFIGDITGKKLFYMEGLWFQSSSGISSTVDDKRKYIKDIFGASIQAHLRTGELCFFNQFSASYGNTNNVEEDNFTKRYAAIEHLNYEYDGRLRLTTNNLDHFLLLSFASEEDLSYSIVNSYDRIPGETNQWAYFEHGKDLRYVTEHQKYGAEYKMFIRDGEWRCNWILSAGVNSNKYEKSYKLFPARYSQDFTINELFVKANRDFSLSEISSIDISVNGSVYNADGNMLDVYRPLDSGALALNQSLLEQDFAYQTADRFVAGLGMKYRRMVNMDKGSSIYLGASYNHMDAGDLGNRGYFSLSFGMNF
jgi:hypothetical protein